MKNRIAIMLRPAEFDAESLTAMVDDIAEVRFDSVWVSEILTTPGPDPLLALAWAAQANPHLKLGATLVLPGRNLVRLAKELASLDVLTRGRLLLTFVPGLARGVEGDAVGVPVRERGRAIEEAMPKLRRWWAGEAVDDVAVTPQPTQQPLEIWLGGIAPASLVRCGRLADGWLAAACSPREAELGRGVIERAAVEAGRVVDPEHFGMSIRYSREPIDDTQLAELAARTRGRDVDPRTLVPVGVKALRQRLVQFIDAGFSKFVLIPAASPLPWRAEMEDLAAAVAELQS